MCRRDLIQIVDVVIVVRHHRHEATPRLPRRLHREAHPKAGQTHELARKKGGHGGMDFIMAYRLVECMREGTAPDFDVYDAASWSAPMPLSQMSVAKGSAPLKFPDFTRGEWSRARA
jgi:hypothetical protein